jgi:hypothetical protein
MARAKWSLVIDVALRGIFNRPTIDGHLDPWAKHQS